MCIKLISIALLAALLFPVGTRAQDSEQADPFMMEDLQDYYGDEAFVTIATGSRKPIYKAPAVATVITAEEIKAMGARNLDDVLETVAGIHVAPSTQGRMDSIYSIRGIHTKVNPQVLVLINGLAFPHFTGGRPYQFRFPVVSISRIEVIRGPGSAIFGADAFSGVINIITKNSEEIGGTDVGGRAGSFDTYDFWFQHGDKYGDFEIAYMAEWQQSRGDDDRIIRSDIQSVLDREFGTDASFAPGPLDTRYDIFDSHLELQRKDWRLRHWYWEQKDAGLGAGSAFALDPQGGEDVEQHLIEVSYRNKDLMDWDLEGTVSYLYRKGYSRFVLLPPNTKAPIGSDGNLNFVDPVAIVTFPEGIIGRPAGPEEGFGFDSTVLYTGMPSHRWRIGLGIKYQSFEVSSERKNFGPGVIDGSQQVVEGDLKDISDTPFVFLPASHRTVWYFSLQDEYQLARDWELTSGIRYDHYSDFGDTVNPRLALVWATSHKLTSKILYGRAFRAPSFLEQFSLNNPVALGNPNLEPEKIDTFEVAFDYRPTFDVHTNLSLYAYKARDLIEFVPDNSGTNSTAKNSRDQEGYGFEAEIDWSVKEGLRFGGSYSFQRSVDDKSNSRIPDAPAHKIYMYAHWQFWPKWIFYPQFTWIGDRVRDTEDPRRQISDYSIVDLTLNRNNFYGFDLTFAVRNALNTGALEPSTQIIPTDYPLSGRHFWAGISYDF